MSSKIQIFFLKYRSSQKKINVINVNEYDY